MACLTMSLSKVYFLSLSRQVLVQVGAIYTYSEEACGERIDAGGACFVC